MRERERRPMAAAGSQCCESCEHRSPHFRWAAEPVSAKESDRLFAIAHPNAAVSAAVGIKQCRGLGPPQAGSTRGGIAHLVVVKRLHKVSLFFLRATSAGTPAFNVLALHRDRLDRSGICFREGNRRSDIGISLMKGCARWPAATRVARCLPTCPLSPRSGHAATALGVSTGRD